MPTISDEDRTLEAAADLVKEMKRELPAAAKGKNKWIKIIKKLQAVLANGELRVARQGPPRVTTQGQIRVNGGATTSTSPTFPQTLHNSKRIHQQTTRHNTPVNAMTVIDPVPKGESPRQTQKINKGRSTAKPKKDSNKTARFAAISGVGAKHRHGQDRESKNKNSQQTEHRQPKKPCKRYRG